MRPIMSCLRPSRRAILTAFGLGAPLLAMGCADPAYQVIMTAPRGAFVGQKRFAVFPIDWSHLLVGSEPEAAYLARKSPEQCERFAADKAALGNIFFDRFGQKAFESSIMIVPATGPADAPLFIRPTVHFLEPGFYGGIVGASSEVRMNVRIVAADGRVLEELELTHGTRPVAAPGIAGGGVPSTPTVGQRLRKDGEGLGEELAAYLGRRVAGV